MSSIAIRVRNLSKRYTIGRARQRHDTLRDAISSTFQRSNVQRSNVQPFWALQDVSFEVRRGEVVGIIGRNGAGKSTLLKILSRITEPTQGRVEIFGRVGSLLEVGTGFHPELTGRENIYLNGAILGMRRAEIERKFDEIVDFSEIEQFLDTPVKRYSSGMYVRLAFAVAAHLDPEILLVDEVLAVGDAAFQKKCLDQMGDVARHGRTILFVSHNMAAVQRLCSRSVLLDSGSICFEGETATAVRMYQTKPDAASCAGAVTGVRRNVLADQTSDAIRIVDVALLQRDGQPLQHLSIADGLRVRLSYLAMRPIIAPGFVVKLATEKGVELCRVSNMPISGYYIDRVEGEGVIEVEFSSLPFTGGRYEVSVGVARANVEVLTWLDDVAWFEITASDAYGSGLAMDTSRGAIVIPHNWSHASEAVR